MGKVSVGLFLHLTVKVIGLQRRSSRVFSKSEKRKMCLIKTRSELLFEGHISM